MRGIQVVLILLAACTDPELGQAEQALAPTCDSYTICNSMIVDDCYRWAGAAPCGSGETPCTDPMDGGLCLSYVPHVVQPTSCEGRCGGVAPSGCSCDEDCSWNGTCCSDIATRCTGSGDGQAFVNNVMPREVSQSGAAVKGQLRTDAKFVAMNDPAAVGLTKVDFGVTNDQSEHSQCRVTDTLSDGGKFGCTTAGGACYVEASVDYDNNRATCAAGGLRFPAGWGAVQSGAVSVRVGCQSGCSGSGSGGALSWDGANYTESVCMGGSETGSIPFFTQVKIENVDNGNEHPGCWFEFYGGTSTRISSTESSSTTASAMSRPTKGLGSTFVRP